MSAAHEFRTRIRRVIFGHRLELLELLKYCIAQHFGRHALGSMLGEGGIRYHDFNESAVPVGFCLILFPFVLSRFFPSFHVVSFLVTGSRCINGIFIVSDTKSSIYELKDK